MLAVFSLLGNSPFLMDVFMSLTKNIGNFPSQFLYLGDFGIYLLLTRRVY